MTSALRRLRHLAAPLLVATAATALAAQDPKPCKLVLEGTPLGGVDSTRIQYYNLANGSRITYVGGGVDARCEGQGNRLLADSAEHYESRGELILINRVRYSDPRVSMQSSRMVYYTIEERIHATGNVRGRMTSGTRFTGPEMEYWRAKPGLRDVPRWRAPGRPFVRMAPDSVRNRTVNDSTDLTADLVLSDNDSLITARGQVVIERTDLRATADSATMDRPKEQARLMRGPRIVGQGQRSFTLVGRVVDIWSRAQKLERVLAADSAHATSDSLDLRGDSIDLRMAEQRIQRAYIWGSRAYANGPKQWMEADSLDVHLPNQQIREVRAFGRAITRSAVDSTKVVSDEPDWIAGESIVALFDSLAPGDSATARMRQVTATGDARSYYQLAPSSGERGVPNINYNRGREIVVSFIKGEVDVVQVRDQASGLYLEPPVAPKTKPDSTVRRP